MARSFARRLAVATGAGASLFTATVGVWRFAQRAGFIEDPWSEDSRRSPDFCEVATIGALAGVIVGAGYAVVRPILPRQPELAGLLYGFGSGFATRVQLNAMLRFFGREPRKLTSSTLASDALLGLWLAETERLFG